MGLRTGSGLRLCRAAHAELERERLSPTGPIQSSSAARTVGPGNRPSIEDASPHAAPGDVQTYSMAYAENQDREKTAEATKTAGKAKSKLTPRLNPP